MDTRCLVMCVINHLVKYGVNNRTSHRSVTQLKKTNIFRRAKKPKFLLNFENFRYN